MFDTVLILTDFSEHSQRVSECITGISGIREIVLLHVIQDIQVQMGKETVEGFVTRAAENSLRTEKRNLETLCPDLKITPVLTVSSDVAGTILETAEKHKADLIVISSYGMSVRAGVLTGNVATAVLCRISRINVLVMRHKIIETLTGKTFEKFCPQIFSRILCPVDFSLHSEQAVALAGTLKGAGEIVLLHVVNPDGPEREIQEAATAASGRIRAVSETLAAQGVRSRAIVKTGHPASVIAETAEEEDVSVIWISSYGKGCFHDFLLGSTVNDVVMNTNRPVIVIRAMDRVNSPH